MSEEKSYTRKEYEELKGKIKEFFVPILPEGISKDLISMSVAADSKLKKKQADEDRRQGRCKAYSMTLDAMKKIKVDEKTFKIKSFDILGEKTGEKYRISILNAEQIETGIPLLFGSLNPCCFSLGGSGDGYMRASMDNRDTSFLIVEGLAKGKDSFDDFGKNPIFMEMLCWKSQDSETLVLDTVDAVQKRKNKGLDPTGEFYLQSNIIKSVIAKASEQILEQNSNIQQVNLGVGGLTLIAMNSLGENKLKAEKLQGAIQKLEDLGKLLFTKKLPDQIEWETLRKDTPKLTEFRSELEKLSGYKWTTTKIPDDSRLYETTVKHTFNSLVQVEVARKKKLLILGK